MPAASFKDRVLIRELYGRYALGAASKDTDIWIGCWAEEGVWKTPHFETGGRPALREQWAATWTNFANVAAFVEVGDIHVSADAAQAISSVYEIISLAAGGTLKMAGLYRDAFVREGGEWRFARREYELLSEEMTPPA